MTPQNSLEPVLRIRGLCTEFPTARGPLKAV